MSLGQCCASGFKVSPPDDDDPSRLHSLFFCVIPARSVFTNASSNARVQHDGTPSGKTEDINGVKTCQWRNPSRGEKRLKLTSKCSLTTTTTTTTHSDISLPKGDYEKSKALLFLTEYAVPPPFQRKIPPMR